MIGTLIMIGCLAATPGTLADDPAPPITSLAFSPDGRQVVAASQAGARILTWPGLKPTGELDVDYANIHDVAFSDDGRRLAVAGGDPAQRGGFIVFSWPDSKPLFRRDDHEDVVYALDWLAEGSRWLSAGLDQMVRLYQANGELVHTIQGHSRGVKAACFLRNGVIVTSGIDQNIRVWDAESVDPIRALNNHTAPIHAMAVRPSTGIAESLPMLVSVSDDRTIRFWQPTIGRMVRFARLRRAVPLDVAWSPDGSSVLAVANDGQLRIIDPELATIKASRPAIDGWAYCLAVHPDGRFAIVGGAGGSIVKIDLSKIGKEPSR